MTDKMRYHDYYILFAEACAAKLESSFKYKAGDRVEYRNNMMYCPGTVTLAIKLQEGRGYLVAWDDGYLSNLSYEYCWKEEELTPILF